MFHINSFRYHHANANYNTFIKGRRLTYNPSQTTLAYAICHSTNTLFVTSTCAHEHTDTHPVPFFGGLVVGVRLSVQPISGHAPSLVIQLKNNGSSCNESKLHVCDNGIMSTNMQDCYLPRMFWLPLYAMRHVDIFMSLKNAGTACKIENVIYAFLPPKLMKDMCYVATHFSKKYGCMRSGSVVVTPPDAPDGDSNPAHPHADSKSD